MLGIKLRKSSKKMFSLETIDFQNDNFGPELEAIFGDIATGITSGAIKSNKDIEKQDFLIRIEKLINNRLGLNIEIETNVDSIGAILVMPVNDHNILIPDDFKGHDFIKEIKKQAKYENKDKGYIDLKNAKVSGIFSTYKHVLYMNIYNNVKIELFTPGEMTAIMLHELGHAFTWYEYSDRLESTNQVMQTILTELNKKEKNLTYIYRELEGNFKLSKEEIDDIVNTPSGIILGYKIFNVMIKEYTSQLPVDKYSETSSEQLADQFANRFGYGRQLVCALDKLAKKHPGMTFVDIIYSVTVAMLLVTAVVSFLMFVAVTILSFSPLLGLVASIAMGVSLIPTVIAAIIGGCLGGMIALLIVKIFHITGHMTYDEGVTRYKRIRNDLISLLKIQGLHLEDKQSIINDVNNIDNIIKNPSIKPALVDSIIEGATNLFRKEAVNDIKIQRLLEELASSDLFLKSAQLVTATAN